MIILDTNQLEATNPPDGPLMVMLAHVASSTGHTLAVPEIALTEHLARYQHKVTAARDKLTSAFHELKGLVPVWRAALPELPPTDATLESYRGKELTDFGIEVIKLSEGAALTALRREARRQAPAQEVWNKPGSGGRDVAIWCAVVEKCQTLDEQIYFVSNDKNAFGEESLKSDLRNDLIRVMGIDTSRFHYCSDIEALLRELATPSSRVPTQEQIGSSELVRRAATSTLSNSRALLEFMDTSGVTGFSSYAGSVDSVVLGSILESKSVVAYAIEKTTWVCARPIWQGQALLTVAPGGFEKTLHIDVSFTVPMTIVMQLDSDGEIIEAAVSRRGALRVTTKQGIWQETVD